VEIVDEPGAYALRSVPHDSRGLALFHRDDQRGEAGGDGMVVRDIGVVEQATGVRQQGDLLIVLGLVEDRTVAPDRARVVRRNVVEDPCDLAKRVLRGCRRRGACEGRGDDEQLRDPAVQHLVRPIENDFQLQEPEN
jgi:hypothetical protein